MRRLRQSNGLSGVTDRGDCWGHDGDSRGAMMERLLAVLGSVVSHGGAVMERGHAMMGVL